MAFRKEDIAVVIILVTAVLIIASLLNLMMTPASGSSGVEIVDTDMNLSQILVDELNFYNERFNTSLPVPKLILNLDADVDMFGAYKSALTYNIITKQKEITGEITIFNLSACEKNPVFGMRYLTRHELCHYFLHTHCKLDWLYSYDELPTEFEEPFCEGFTVKTLRAQTRYQDNETYYDDFLNMPSGFFECGLRTCDPMGCYKEETGEIWTTNI